MLKTNKQTYLDLFPTRKTPTYIRDRDKYLCSQHKLNVKHAVWGKNRLNDF